MLVIAYGTTGELIKIAPLLKRLDRKSYILLDTQQQPTQLAQLRQQAGLPEADYYLASGHKGQDMEKIIHAPMWAARAWTRFFKLRPAIKKRLKVADTKNLMIVHGDTMTTVFGAMMGRALGIPVAHIEAGLRSFNWFHPFPEEIDRHIVSRLARVHFTPGDTPFKNLEHVKGERINTTYNTVKDSVALAAAAPVVDSKVALPSKFGIVSIHRNELLSRPEDLKQIMQTLSDYSRGNLPLLFMNHPVTAVRLAQLRLDTVFDDKHFIRLPKQSYYSFMNLVGKADFIVTDSGGLQEEAAYLNVPCLVHRKATEREEGLGKNVVLSHLDMQVVRDFLDHYADYKQTKNNLDKVSPTQVICDYLKAQHYI